MSYLAEIQVKVFGEDLDADAERMVEELEEAIDRILSEFGQAHPEFQFERHS